MVHMGVVQYSFISSWGLAPCLRGACARTVWLTMVFGQAHHTKTKYRERTLVPTLRRACAELARARFLTNYVILGFRLSKIVDKGIRTIVI